MIRLPNPPPNFPVPRALPRGARRFNGLIALFWMGLTMSAGLPLPAQAASGAQALQLEVLIDGHSTNLVAEIFRNPEGRFSARRSELREIGVVVPGQGKDGDIVPFEAIPGLGMRYDEAGQKMHLTLAAESRLAREYTPETANGHVVREKITVAREYGNVFNYGLFGSMARGYTSSGNTFSTGTATVENRTYSPYGVVQNSGILGTSLSKEGFLRLDSSYSYADRETSTVATAGDAISGGLNWTRSVRFGGAQVSRQLGLRSDLITAPLPSVSGSAAVPSTVDVYVDNVRIARQDVAAGPFRLTNLPVPGESGTARIVVRDVTGKETVTSMPFFTSSKLLAPGTFDFSVDAGYPRHGYAIASFDYSNRIMGMGSARYGLTDWLTLEGHAEGASRLAQAGLGSTVSAGKYGLFSAAGAGSWHNSKAGALLHASWQIGLRGVFVGASTQRTLGTFEDVASVTARNIPTRLSDNLADSGFYQLQRSPRVARAVDRVTLGIPIERLNASLALSFVNIERADRDRSHLVNITYSQTIARKYNAFVNAYGDLAAKREAGITAGLSFMIGDDITITASGTPSRSGHSGTLDISRGIGPKDHDYGWRLYDSEGTYAQRGASASYRNAWARASAGVRQDRSTIGGFGELDGAIVTTPSGVFASRRINDAFAIVDVGSPGVEVLHENRPVGKTDWRGVIVVPDMQSFQRTKIAISPETLPGDKHASLTETDVMPGFRGAGTVSVKSIAASDTASVEIRDAKGEHFPAGTRVKLAETGHSFTIGYGGITYLPEIGNENTLLVQQGMSECRVRFSRADRQGPQGAVGPLACRAE